MLLPLCEHIEAEANGRYFANDIFKYIFLNENTCIAFKISLKFVPKAPINNILALVQIMAWRQPGDKPLSEPMMVSLLANICHNLLEILNNLTVYSWKVSTMVHVPQQACVLCDITYYCDSRCGEVVRFPVSIISHEIETLLLLKWF